MKKFYGYTELLEELIKLKEDYNKEVSIKSAGKSVKGRLIPVIKIGEGRKKQLVVASCHGREFVSSCFIMRCLEDFLKSGCNIKEKALFILPMLNPDGVEIALGRDVPLKKPEGFKAELFKNNADNINLNANFPFCFHKVPQSRQGGRKASSEPETEALISLCEKEHFHSVAALHARGNCIYWRDRGNGRINGDSELAMMLKEGCGFELIPPTNMVEDYSGGFENWFRFRFKKPALCVELVKDENIAFSDMCTSFEDAVNWKKTRSFLRIFTDFS